MVKPGFIDTALTGAFHRRCWQTREQCARAGRRGNPPQSSNHLCPVLVERDALDPAIGRRHTHTPQVLNQECYTLPPEALLKWGPEVHLRAGLEAARRRVCPIGFLTSGQKSDASHSLEQ